MDAARADRGSKRDMTPPVSRWTHSCIESDSPSTPQGPGGSKRRVLQIGEFRGTGAPLRFLPATEHQPPQGTAPPAARAFLPPTSSSGREELAHRRRTGRRAGETRDAERLEHKPQGALVLVESGGLIVPLRLGAHRHPHHAATAVAVVAARLVEHDDQEPILLERR